MQWYSMFRLTKNVDQDTCSVVCLVLQTTSPRAPTVEATVSPSAISTTRVNVETPANGTPGQGKRCLCCHFMTVSTSLVATPTGSAGSDANTLIIVGAAVGGVVVLLVVIVLILLCLYCLRRRKTQSLAPSQPSYTKRVSTTSNEFLLQEKEKS